uniref:Cnidarian restricted protein n=1 Tax=Clytia hemisphaerica TaxID=252671 RepID=A0A7M5VBC5_9CNID
MLIKLFCSFIFFFFICVDSSKGQPRNDVQMELSKSRFRRGVVVNDYVMCTKPNYNVGNEFSKCKHRFDKLQFFCEWHKSVKCHLQLSGYMCVPPSGSFQHRPTCCYIKCSL